MSNFLNDSESLADAKITGALVLRLMLKDFERLKQQLKIEYPNAIIIYQRTSCGKLYIKPESDQP